MRRYATTLIIWVSLIIGELHTLWRYNTEVVNWTITKKVEIPLNWAVKWETDELWFILMGLAILYYIPNRINRATVLSFLIFCVGDWFLYHWDYKSQETYGWLYTILLISWILIYNYERCSNATKRQGIAFKTK